MLKNLWGSIIMKMLTSEIKNHVPKSDTYMPFEATLCREFLYILSNKNINKEHLYVLKDIHNKKHRFRKY